MKQVSIFDSTLRDGAQSEGINFSIEDKLAIVKILDAFGVDYIEAGNPGSNPKDLEFFERVKTLKLKNAKLVSFGATRRKDLSCIDDANILSLLSSETKAVAIFGKCWDLHATEILGTTPENNLKMIADTVSFFKSKGKEVIFDAEHFFDGYKANPDYAVQAVLSAINAGADVAALCDTNGGTFPAEITEIISNLKKHLPQHAKLGIHCHNDCGMAVANSIAAFEAGVSQIQGTFIGYGERCGNANLSTIIGCLQAKRGVRCVPETSIQELTTAAKNIASISNIKLEQFMPYVGRSAFTHKAGMHADGVLKVRHSFEHINPEIIGNERKFVMSEIAGRMAITKLINKYLPDLNKNSPEIIKLAERIKELEHIGYQFESAESSLVLEIYKILGKYSPYFELISYDTSTTQPSIDENSAKAIVKVRVLDKTQLSCAEGNGPVNALDLAIRKSLEVFYPALTKMILVDFKVRVLDSNGATASKVRVLITSTDGENTWTTVGVSNDVIQASFKALTDSIEFKLMSDDGIITREIPQT